jgi:uncharacterized membrane protein YgdD (TMEM256/DUF423 family)
MDRFFMVSSAVGGFFGVALGAFGAHGLKARFEHLPDAARRLEWWATASNYHLIHALALGLVAVLAATHPGKLVATAGGLMLAGLVVFSGSLYAMALTGATGLGAVTPVGGLLLLGGWGTLAVAALRLGS